MKIIIGGSIDRATGEITDETVEVNEDEFRDYIEWLLGYDEV